MATMSVLLNIWHRHLRAVGHLHGLDKVFDSNYIPSNDDDIALFKMQQDFTFSVLTTHVLESRGLLIVRKYSEFDKNPELYGDAQKIYAELVAEYQEGTTAFLTADALEQSILTFTLDSKWNKGVVTFLTSFCLKNSSTTCGNMKWLRQKRRKSFLLHQLPIDFSSTMAEKIGNSRRRLMRLYIFIKTL